MKPLVLLALHLAALRYCEGADPGAFVLDQRYPFVYLKFDHAGPREPAREGEGRDGIWLRLVNNCDLPIEVSTFDLGTSDRGVGLNYDVIRNVGVPTTLKHPDGYSFHVVTASVIRPGKDLVFSIPGGDLGENWHIQVRFEFVLPEPKLGSQPFSIVGFFWTDLPKGIRDRSRAKVE